MKHFIIDGNNVLGKIPSLKKLQLKDKQGSREKLALMVERNFSKRNAGVSLHFDGYPGEEIKILNVKIIYSKNITADEMIKKEIEKSKNPKNLVVITSDSNLNDFARKCSCTIISSEDFSKQIKSLSPAENESKRIQEIDNPDEFKKLFGVK
jgi:predicted RNA-binding protein with PIN domain